MTFDIAATTKSAIADAMIGGVLSSIGGPLPGIWTAYTTYRYLSMAIQSDDFGCTALEIGYGSVSQSAVRRIVQAVGTEILTVETIGDHYLITGDGLFGTPQRVIYIEHPRLTAYHHGLYQEWVPLDSIVTVPRSLDVRRAIHQAGLHPADCLVDRRGRVFVAREVARRLKR